MVSSCARGQHEVERDLERLWRRVNSVTPMYMSMIDQNLCPIAIPRAYSVTPYYYIEIQANSDMLAE
jgi:hypothetical protein